MNGELPVGTRTRPKRKGSSPFLFRSRADRVLPIESNRLDPSNPSIRIASPATRTYRGVVLRRWRHPDTARIRTEIVLSGKIVYRDGGASSLTSRYPAGISNFDAGTDTD
jgi:hypothetical protein